MVVEIRDYDNCFTSLSVEERKEVRANILLSGRPGNPRTTNSLALTSLAKGAIVTFGTVLKILKKDQRVLE